MIMKRISQPKDTSDLIRANLLSAKENLLSQEAALLQQLEQVRKGIESIETTIQVVCTEGSKVATLPVMPTVEVEPSLVMVPTNSATAPDLTDTSDSNGTTPRRRRRKSSAELEAIAPAAPTEEPTAKKTTPKKAPAKKTGVKSAAKASPRSATKTTPKGKTGTKTAAKSATKLAEKKVDAVEPAEKAEKTAKPVKAAKAPRKTRTPKATKAPKAAVSKRNLSWQSYMVKEFANQPLTEVVSSILSRSPEMVIGSKELMNQIFMPTIPKQERVTARDRLLNILSAGVTDSKWYRVKPGHYSLTNTNAE
jgi:hypothetical protein